MPTTTARDRLGRRVRFAGATVGLMSVGLFVWSLATARHNRLPTGGGLGADLLAFYDAGDILRRFGPGRLYDLPLQSAVYHDRLRGEPPDAFLPYAYAPQVAAAFAGLSALPYAVALVVWTGVSVASYVAAVTVAIRSARLPPSWRRTAVWAAVGFEPFAIECVHGGQVSTVAAGLLSAAAALAVAGRPFAAGLVAGCCCYKPTLLLILVPGLAVTRRWRALAGCAAAVAGWAGLDLLTMGVGPCRMYATLLVGYAGRSPLEFRTWKFVDVHSSAILFGGSPAAAAGLVVAAVGVAVLGLRRGQSADDERLFWAAALAWTPVANVYAGAYDAVLVVPAVVLAAGVLRLRRRRLPPAFTAVLVCGWIAPWVTSAVARRSGVQVFSLALIAVAGYVTVAARVGRPVTPESAPAGRPLRGGDHAFTAATA